MSERPRVIVTRRMPEAVEARLEALFDVQLNIDDHQFDNAELIGALQSADGLLGTVTDPYSKDVLAAGGALRARIIANFAVGYNNFDLEAAKAAGIAISNTPGVLTEATADTALTLLLNVLRGTWRFESMLRRGDWQGFGPTSCLGVSPQGKTLGIIGMGRIGRAMARRCYHGLGMKIIYYNRSPVADPEVPEARACATMGEVMAEADVVSLHIPGGAENRHRISRDLLEMMKPGAYLINTARGDVIDEAALIDLLENRRIAGAGLDVFENEPQVPERLLALDNVSLLPHLGSATIETRTAMGMLAVDNLEAFFDGKPMPSRVV